VRPEVEVKKVAIPQGEDTYILCRTSGRNEKEKAIRSRFSNSMEKALQALEKTIVARRLKDRNKMERRLGKIQARHPQVNDLYEVALRETAGNERKGTPYDSHRDHELPVYRGFSDTRIRP
jgi:transposase